jgi:hypothetical protein
MSEMHATLDRLETQIEDQAARIDALYALLELRGILPRRADVGRGDALFDDESEGLDLSCRRQERPQPTVRRAAPSFHVGEATGV